MNSVRIAWHGKHFGEEPPLVGGENQGAGTIFFTGCNLNCVFCQNFQISQQGLGRDYTIPELVQIMLSLESSGAVNIDLVSPTIWWRQIKEAVLFSRKLGLTIPIVWNSNGFEKVEMLRELEGVVDIYLPDLKYSNDELAEKYSGIKNYFETAKLALREMYRQVGNLQIDEEGIAKKGLIVRHMILPGEIENSQNALDVIAEIDPNIHVSLMSQYNPVFEAVKFPEINRKLTEPEFNEISEHLALLNLDNGWSQEFDSSDDFLPDFNKDNPFV